MRNLKKILALVLAVVMSLSLMATASAADFTDASSINEKYETAVEVLEGLGVFRGYQDGSFQPTGSITRAETAAIIYRIVTGDVEDKQVGIYADYNLFTDVPSSAWFAGYVNYCANAEYIKGVGGGKFNPNAQVTGYAALAMILRAIGYTANGGFTGPDWEVQTARVGEARKITKNILTGTLGQPATRESVAEILFQAILVNMVDHNVLAAQNGQQGYFETNTTLGYKTFGLEQIEGVVMANEYANLNGPRVIGANKTDLQVAGEEGTRRLDKGTLITDIGESRYAYVTSSKVLAFGDTGKNKVTETGAAVDISSASKFAAVAAMSSNANTEYYTNFDPHEDGHYTCDQRLEFSVVFYGPQAEAAFDGYKGIDISAIAADDSEWIVENCTLNATTDQAGAPYTKVVLKAGASDYNKDTTTPAYNYPVRYTKIIWAGKDITSTDLKVLESIFGTADNNNNNNMNSKRITGDVFVGTKSTNNAVTDEERDLSNTISYKKFYEEYIIPNTETSNWSVTWNGWWTKFVDNNGDGTAEYAFRTNYELAEALYTYTDRDGDTYLEFSDFDDENWTVKYLDGYTPAVGDKVLAAYIDGQMLVEPAKSEEVVVSSYSWRNDEITTDKDTYGQSGIINATDMMELISTMEDKITYVVYFDHFGYVRAYELPGGKQYALITEMYYTNGNQGNLVDNWPMTAELTTLDADGKTVTEEYNIVGGAGTFTALQPWMRVENAVATYNYNNWLQPAIPHLGVTRHNATDATLDYDAHKGTPVFAANVTNSGDTMETGAYATFWNANRQLVRRIANTNPNGMAGLEEFEYNTPIWSLSDGSWTGTWNANPTASFTNVAIASIEGNDARLTGAASLALNKNAQPAAAAGNAFAYATDYVQLATTDIVKAAVRYPIGGDAAYQTANNTYVNAVHDTQYFIAYNGGVYSFKDYANFPGLTNKDNQIHAAYAVVHNTNAITDSDNAPYWVADVIVYEVYDLDDTTQTSVSLAFYTPTRTSGNVQEIETLNSKYGLVTLMPGNKAWSADRGQWGAEWDGYGFYALNNDTEPVENVMTARSITKITIGNYAKNAIHAGTIYREAYIDGAGEYIDVDLGDGSIASIEITNKIYSITKASAQSDDWYGYHVADPLRYENQTNSQVRKGDMVIWVGAAKTDRTKNSTNFVVDLGSTTDWSADTTAYCGDALLEDTANFLIGLVRDVNGKAVRDVNGELQVISYAGATNSSGIWQQIMKEQNTAPDPFTITVKNVVDATNTITPANVTVTANTFDEDMGKAGFIVEIDVPAPYAVTAVEITNVGKDKAGEFAKITATNEANKYLISGATGNVELKVTVAKVTYQLAVNFDGVAAQSLTLNNAAMTNPATLDKGTAYEVSFTAAANTTYAVDGVKATPNAAGKIVMSGTLNADKTYVITKLEKTLTVLNNTGDAITTVLNDSANHAVAGWTGAPINLNEGGQYKLVLTVPANTTYAVAVGNGAPVEYKNNTASSRTETINVNMATDVTCTVTKLTVTLSANVAGAANITGLQLKVNAGTGGVWTGAATTLNKGADYTISFTPAAGELYTVDSNDVSKETTGDYANKIVVTGTNLTANKSYTIVGRAASNVTVPVSVKIGTTAATVTGTTYAFTGAGTFLPYGTEDATVVFDLAAGSKITNAWKDVAVWGTPVTVTNNSCTLAVGAAGAATTYVFEITAEDGTTKANYTVTLAAVAASADASLTINATGTAMGVTLNAKVVTFPAAATGRVTVAQLKSYLELAAGANCEVMTDVSDATTVQAGTVVVTNAMKILVTAQDGTTTDTYTIAFTG